MTTNMEEPVGEWLTPRAVAIYTGKSKKFWDELRGTPNGPPYSKPSAKCVLYRRSDVDRWLESHMRRSTFDDRKVAA